MLNTAKVKVQHDAVFPVPSNLHFAGIFGDNDADDNDDEQTVTLDEPKPQKNTEIAERIKAVMQPNAEPIAVPLAELQAYQQTAQTLGFAGGLMRVDPRIIAHMESKKLKTFAFPAKLDGQAAGVQSRSGKTAYFRVGFVADLGGSPLSSWCLAPETKKKLKKDAPVNITVTVNNDGQYSYNCKA